MLHIKNKEEDYWNWLVCWVKQQLDGDWENEHGVRIEILDNPGWLLSVDLVSYEAILSNIKFSLSFPDVFLSLRVDDAYLYISTSIEHLSLLPYVLHSVISHLEQLKAEKRSLSLEELKMICIGAVLK